MPLCPFHPLRLSAPVLLAVLASACTVGPEYARPESPPPAPWLESTAIGEVDTRWWQAFGDPELDRLVALAAASSPDVKETRARLAEARAGRDAAAGGAMPQVQAQGSATTNRLSENGQIPIGNFPGFERDFDLFDLGFDASWEIDLWGRNRRVVEAAEARVAVAEWSSRDVTLAVVAEVARNYFEMRTAQAELAEAQVQADSLAELAMLAKLRFDAGEDDRRAVDDAAGQVANARVAQAQAEAAVGSAAYRIAALLGVRPETIVPQLRASAAPVPLPPDAIAMGIRSDLLERRPDVRRAERDLAASTAEVGVATADLFPRFSLMGGFGQQGRALGQIDSGSSTRFSVGPSFSWPVFSGGRIRAQIRAADARTDAAAARYEKAVTGALADSESAANRFARAQIARREAAAAEAAAQSAVDLANLRFRRGEDNRLMLRQAQVKLVQTRSQLAKAKGAEAQAAIALYKALGGGWQDGVRE